MGDVWGHVGLGMGPILITPESIFMALDWHEDTQPGMPGAVPIGGRCPVQSKSAQHKAESGRIPAYKPPDGEGMKLPGGFIMPPPPPAPVPPPPRLEPSQPLCPPPGAWGHGPSGHGPYNDDAMWSQPPGFIPTSPTGGTHPDKPRSGWYERCIDMMVLVDNLPFNEHTHECKQFLRQLQRIRPPNSKPMPRWRDWPPGW